MHGGYVDERLSSASSLKQSLGVHKCKEDGEVEKAETQCIIYYTPSVHKIHQTRRKIIKLRDIWLQVSAVTGHLQAN